MTRLVFLLALACISTSWAKDPRSGDPAPGLESALHQLATEKQRYLDDLKTLVGFASVSALPEHSEDLLAAAEWLRGRLEKAGLQVRRMLRASHPTLTLSHGSPSWPVLTWHVHGMHGAQLPAC